MQQQAMVPNVITYSVLISTCEKGNQPKQAVEEFGKGFQEILKESFGIS